MADCAGVAYIGDGSRVCVPASIFSFYQLASKVSTAAEYGYEYL